MEEKILTLIKENEEVFESAFTNKPASAEEIAQAEKELGVKLPEAYVWFLQKWGGGFGMEIYGTDSLGGNLISSTIEERENGLPHNLVVIRNCGEYVKCINCDNGKIGSWSNHDKDGLIERDYDFYSYFLDELENEIDNY